MAVLLRSRNKVNPEGRYWQMSVRVEDQATFNISPYILLAALDGLDIAFLPEEEFATRIEERLLVRGL